MNHELVRIVILSHLLAFLAVESKGRQESQSNITAALIQEANSCKLELTFTCERPDYHVRIDEIVFPNAGTTNEQFPDMIIAATYHINAVGLSRNPSNEGGLWANDDPELGWNRADYITPAKYPNHTIKVTYVLEGLEELVSRRLDYDSIDVTVAEIVPRADDREIVVVSGHLVLDSPVCYKIDGTSTVYSFNSDCNETANRIGEDAVICTPRYVAGVIVRQVGE
ncbi:MAG TPA: hypothetical protein PLW14_12895 [Chlorobiota bacterium]|nr:hypothetical protein [Chlorobiota bacterium]